MIFSFDYKQFGKRFLPVIPVKLKHKTKTLITDAYVDSGASISIFNSEIAEFLEIDYTKGKTIHPSGPSGTIKAYLVETVIEIHGIQITCNVLFSNEISSKFNLLGLLGVFDKFKITFDNRSKKVIFHEYWV